MKSRWKLAILAALVSLLLAAPALAWDEVKVKAQVQEMFDQAAAGFVKKDVQAVTANNTPNTTIKYRDGRTMNTEQWREAVAKEFTDWQDVTSKFVVKKVWPRGKDQVGAFYTESHQFTRISDPGHKHAISAHFRVVLTKTPQGLRFLEFTDLGIQVTRDGRPVNPKAKAKPSKGRPV
jgi:hypothetical protein